MLMYCFNGTCGTHRHEDGGLYVAVVGMYHASARIATGGVEVEGQHSLKGLFGLQKYTISSVC